MLIELIVMTILGLVMTLTPKIPGQHWLIRVWEFPRVQIIFVLAVMTGAWLLLGLQYIPWSFVGIALLTGCIAYQIFWIMPYIAIWPAQVKRASKPDPDHQITILNSNVYMHNREYQRLLNLVDSYQPDILVTLESDDKWQVGLASLHELYPHRIACPLDNLYGMHLYSRLPFKTQSLDFLIEDGVPSMYIEIEIEGQTVNIHCLHPAPASPTENETAGPRDTELMLVGRKVADYANPVIITGDLNDVAWSPSTRKFRKVSGALDPRIGRGFFNTFHAKHKLLRWPLDHVFHSDHFELAHIERLPSIGSDHFPLLVTLQLKA